LALPPLPGIVALVSASAELGIVSAALGTRDSDTLALRPSFSPEFMLTVRVAFSPVLIVVFDTEIEVGVIGVSVTDWVKVGPPGDPESRPPVKLIDTGEEPGTGCVVAAVLTLVAPPGQDRHNRGREPAVGARHVVCAGPHRQGRGEGELDGETYGPADPRGRRHRHAGRVRALGRLGAPIGPAVGSWGLQKLGFLGPGLYPSPAAPTAESIHRQVGRDPGQPPAKAPGSRVPVQGAIGPDKGLLDSVQRALPIPQDV
jgi:hypothetical protein